MAGPIAIFESTPRRRILTAAARWDDLAHRMKPICLTDDELDAVMSAARPLSVESRDRILAASRSELAKLRCGRSRHRASHRLRHVAQFSIRPTSRPSAGTSKWR
jgi:hypothetical protein